MVQGKAWTSDEVNQLLGELREKKTFKEISDIHGRTVNAVKFKTYSYACNQVLKDGKTVGEVSTDMCISEEILNKELNSRQFVKPSIELRDAAVPVVVKKGKELRDILKLVNSVQSRLARYVNASDKVSANE